MLQAANSDRQIIQTLLSSDGREERRLGVQKLVEISGGDDNTVGDLSVYVLEGHLL